MASQSANYAKEDILLGDVSPICQPVLEEYSWKQFTNAQTVPNLCMVAHAILISNIEYAMMDFTWIIFVEVKTLQVTTQHD